MMILVVVSYSWNVLYLVHHAQFGLHLRCVRSCIEVELNAALIGRGKLVPSILVKNGLKKASFFERTQIEVA